jgi:integrase
MMLHEEWDWLEGITRTKNVERYGVPAVERVLLYATAIQTGLRSGELRSLTRGRLFLEREKPFITCKAARTKNHKEARQYINRDLADELTAHIQAKLPKAGVFGMPHECDVAKMLREDVAAARAAWLRDAGTNVDELAHRESSDFLEAVNHEGEALDFHALRHTCGAWLALDGAHPNEVKSVMRHSSITLTMDTYGHLIPFSGSRHDRPVSCDDRTRERGISAAGHRHG